MTDNEIRRICAATRKADWRTIEKQILAAKRRDERGGSTAPDGFPSGHTGRGTTVEDPETGEIVSVTLTGVEAAAASLLEDRIEADELRQWVSSVLDLLERANVARGGIENLLGRIAGNVIAVEIEHCELCEPEGIRHAWDTYSRDMVGLDRPMHLCEPGRQFIAKRGRKPSPEEIRYHADKGRWKVRIDPRYERVS